VVRADINAWQGSAVRMVVRVCGCFIVRAIMTGCRCAAACWFAMPSFVSNFCTGRLLLTRRGGGMGRRCAGSGGGTGCRRLCVCGMGRGAIIRCRSRALERYRGSSRVNFVHRRRGFGCCVLPSLMQMSNKR
jgi:hypothetical protein